MKKKENIRVGVNLLRQLSTTFYPHSNSVFSELLTNSRDGMATEVRINISPGSIVIEDNGEGMSRDELVKFFYISHSEKKQAHPKKVRGISRQVIGRFGIGKLSMYQLCKSFEIVAWKDGQESNAEFSFTDIEKKDFIDELDLVVESRKAADKRKTGTRIVMTVLKADINVKMLRRHLQSNMPLTPDFEVFLNSDYPLRPFKLDFGTAYDVDETIPSLGKVTGKVVYCDSIDREEAGIYVRVFGRVVNQNPRLIDLANLTSGQYWAFRVWADLNVDTLDEAIQSNRSGFIVDNLKYQTFLRWLRSKLNYLNGVQAKREAKDKEAKEQDTVPQAIAPILHEKVENIQRTVPKVGKLFAKIGTATAKKHNPKKDSTIFLENKFLVNDGILGVEVKPLGETLPECVIEKGNLLINSQHPFYIQARKRRCLEFHSLKAACMALALAMSNNLEQFKEAYNALAADLEKKNMNLVPIREKKSVSMSI